MNRLAAAVPAGSEGLVFLPFLAGAGTPENDPDARGVFHGLTLKHGRGHCARAIQESIAYLLRKILADFARSGSSFAEVRSMGGGARSDLWLQIKADVTGLPIVRMEEEETSTLGAAILAAVRCGDFPDAGRGREGHGPSRPPLRTRPLDGRRVRPGVRPVQRPVRRARADLPALRSLKRTGDGRDPWMRLKAGYVSFGTQYYEPANLAMISGRAEAQLEQAGIDLARTAPVFGEGPEPERAIRELEAGDFDFLFANIVNWIEVRGVIRVLLEFRHLPVLLYSLGGFTEGGTLICPAAGAGVAAMRYPLERMGFRFKHLFNGPDQPMDIPGILAFARAARAERLLKRTRLGMIGWNDMGLFTTDFSVVKLRDRIGCEVESVDMLQVDRRMQALDAGRVAAETKRVTAGWEYPLAKPSPEAVDRVMRLYLATVDLCREKGFAGFSYKCVDGVDREMGLTHAVPSSLVASAGYPYIDENDVGNLVAEMMLHYVSGQPVMFLEHYDHHPEWILLGEDGYIPDAFIDGRPQIKSISTALLGGLAHCSQAEDRAHDPRLSRRGRHGLPHAHRHRRGPGATAVGGDGRAPAVVAEREVPPRRHGAADPRPRAVAALRHGVRGLDRRAGRPLPAARHHRDRRREMRRKA